MRASNGVGRAHERLERERRGDDRRLEHAGAPRRSASPPQAAIRCVPLISARPSFSASSTGSRPARRSASPPGMRSPSNERLALADQSTSARWASGARSPEAADRAAARDDRQRRRARAARAAARRARDARPSGRVAATSASRQQHAAHDLVRAAARRRRRRASARGCAAAARASAAIDAHAREARRSRSSAPYTTLALGDHRSTVSRPRTMRARSSRRAAAARRRGRRARARQGWTGHRCYWTRHAYGCLAASGPHDDIGPRHPRAPRGLELSLRGLAAGSRAAHAHEQPRPRRRRGSRPTSSSTAAPAAPRARGRRSTRSSRRCGGSRTTRRCSCRSGKPVGVFRTHEMAPRVLIANSHCSCPTGPTGRRSGGSRPRA